MKNNSSSRLLAQQSARLVLGGFVGLFLVLATLGRARPIETDDTDTLEAGLTEIENGVEFEQAPDGHEVVVTPAVTYGLAKNLEVELGLDYVFENPDDEPVSQTWKPAAKFKTKFWSSVDGNLSLAFKGKVAFPITTSGPEGSNDPEGYARLLATKLAGPWQYDFNFGYKYRGAWNSGGNDRYNVGTAVRYKVSTDWQLLAEIYAEIPDRHTAGSKALVDAAVKYRIRDGLKVDLLVGTGVGRDAIELRVVTGIKWEF